MGYPLVKAMAWELRLQNKIVNIMFKQPTLQVVSISMDAHQRSSLRRGSGLDFYFVQSFEGGW